MVREAREEAGIEISPQDLTVVGVMHGAGEASPKARNERVDIIAGDALKDAADYWHAAMLLQHGDSLDDSWRAHELAKHGAALGHAGCRWLAAAAYDRWLVTQGKPQKYGTQSRMIDGRLELCEVDPATTDAERTEWLVKPLAELRPDEPSNLRVRRVRDERYNLKVG